MNRYKSPFVHFVLFSCVFLQFSIFTISAQTAQGVAIAPMSHALETKIQATRQLVLNNNPTLNSEEKSLLAQLESLKHPSPNMDDENRLRIHQQWVNHEKSVRAAAIKIDPSLALYF